MTGNAELDLRPVNGATVLDRGGERLIAAEATAAVEASTEEAISFTNLLFLLLLLVLALLLSCCIYVNTPFSYPLVYINTNLTSFHRET